MKINIIIVGGFNSECHTDIDAINNYKKWNNPLQADFFDIEKLISKLQAENYKKVKVICLDPMYPFSKSGSDSGIHYINEPFILGEHKHFSKKGHNIVIEFANILDEFFVTKDNSQADCMKLYNNYKMSWVSCGCGWIGKLPIQLIMTLILESVYTPTDVSDKYSYAYAIKFNEVYQEKEFSPYSQGLYQILGTLMWRGYKDNNYKYEDVLYDLFEFLDTSGFPHYIQADLQTFLDRQTHWNHLQRPTRLFLNEYVFGKNILTD